MRMHSFAQIIVAISLLALASCAKNKSNAEATSPEQGQAAKPGAQAPQAQPEVEAVPVK